MTAEPLLYAQRAAFLAESQASAQIRIDRLNRAVELLVANQQSLCETLTCDFGQRPAAVSRLMDVFPAIHALKFARRHVRAWMRPRRRWLGAPLGLSGARGEIQWQPLGVVGVISPWNFPVNLTFGPLAGILAAGNRCLIKPSELTAHTSELMRTLIARYFDATEIAVVTGGPEVAESFAKLPFDHVLFTGSTRVGRRVMAAAAEHLVPVTLELGGKCPAVIGRSANLARAVDRILLGKIANAGQTCLAPDYVCAPRETADELILLAQAWLAKAYPDLPSNVDYTNIIDTRHLRRALDLVEDARAKGAKVIELTANAAPASASSRAMNPMILMNVTDEMHVMQEEIFAPILPVQLYDHLDDVIAYVNARPRPLAAYYFGNDQHEESEFLCRTHSGGVTLNDVVMHFLAEELPFGGVGASGMGAYHGEHGFQRFSHARTVVRTSQIDSAGLLGLRPPYGRRLALTLRWLLRR